MNVKQDLHRLVDQLADSELETARKILERLHVDLDEDPVSPEELVEMEQGSAQIDARAGEFALHADAFNRRADNYAIPGGTQPNSYVNGDGYALGGSYFFGTDFLGLGAVHYAAKYGVPSDTTYIDMHQTKRTLRSAFGGGGDLLKRVTVDAGSADYEHSEIDPATGDVLATFKDNEWDARVESTLSCTVSPRLSRAI